MFLIALDLTLCLFIFVRLLMLWSLFCDIVTIFFYIIVCGIKGTSNWIDLLKVCHVALLHFLRGYRNCLIERKIIPFKNQSWIFISRMLPLPLRRRFWKWLTKKRSLKEKKSVVSRKQLRNTHRHGGSSH